jgi:hypothetical protein
MIAGPSQFPRVDKPQPASVPGTRTAVAGHSWETIAQAVQNGSIVIYRNNWQFSKDNFNGSDVKYLFLVAWGPLEPTDSSQPKMHNKYNTYNTYNYSHGYDWYNNHSQDCCMFPVSIIYEIMCIKCEIIVEFIIQVCEAWVDCDLPAAAPALPESYGPWHNLSAWVSGSTWTWLKRRDRIIIMMVGPRPGRGPESLSGGTLADSGELRTTWMELSPLPSWPPSESLCVEPGPGEPVPTWQCWVSDRVNQLPCRRRQTDIWNLDTLNKSV